MKQKIERIFRIWEQRGIYNEEFLSDLHGLLSINPAKKPLLNEGDDEQATITVATIRNCVRLEKETDRCFKLLPKTPLCDTDQLPSMKGESARLSLDTGRYSPHFWQIAAASRKRSRR